MTRPIVLDDRPLGERLEERRRIRDDRLHWIKNRALAYLPNDVAGAVASFTSDVNKDWDGQPAPFIDMTKPVMQTLLILGLRAVQNNDAAEARRWIEGFN